MIGYCATASSGIEIAPIRQMKSATTQAKIGLSIKKPGIDLSPVRLLGQIGRRIRFGPGLRPDLVAGREFLEAFDYDPVAGFQTIGDEPHPVLHRPRLHRLDRYLSVFPHD